MIGAKKKGTAATNKIKRSNDKLYVEDSYSDEPSWEFPGIFKPCIRMVNERFAVDVICEFSLLERLSYMIPSLQELNFTNTIRAVGFE